MKENKDELYEKKRQDCWNGAFHTFGYGYIFGLKSKSLRRILKFNTFLGIIIPVLVGGMVTTYGLNFEFLKIILIVAGPLALVQLFLSVWIISYNLEDKYSFFIESSTENYNISQEFEELGKYPPERLSSLNHEIEKIEIKKKNRSVSDSKYLLSDKEKRKGMRYSLRNFKRKCAGCDIIPIDMKSSNCGICGKF